MIIIKDMEDNPELLLLFYKTMELAQWIINICDNLAPIFLMKSEHIVQFRNEAFMIRMMANVLLDKQNKEGMQEVLVHIDAVHTEALDRVETKIIGTVKYSYYVTNMMPLRSKYGFYKNYKIQPKQT